MSVLFTSIASSSAGCAYILSREDGQFPLLLDAGVGFAEIQQATGFRVSQLEGVLISHAHGDHAKAVKKLLERGVRCYASAYTWEALTHTSPYAQTVGEGDVFRCGPWTTMAVPAVHDLPGTFGFFISGFGKRCLYLTDSAYSPSRYEGLTHLFIECNHSHEIMRRRAVDGDMHRSQFKRTMNTHMSIETLIDMLKANDLSSLEEVHLLHMSDSNSDEAAFRTAIQRIVGVPVYVAQKRGIPTT